jgi:hypothetical protein
MEMKNKNKVIKKIKEDKNRSKEKKVLVVLEVV